MNGGNAVYTKQELKSAEKIIREMARANHVPEAQVRADIQEAMQYGRSSPDPAVQARWAKFHYWGAEPTVEEFILWMTSRTRRGMMKK